MTMEAVRNALQKDFQTVWSGAYPGQTILWDNTTPDSDTDLPTSDHVRFSILFQEHRLVGLGAPVCRWRQYGQISIVVHTALGIGPLPMTKALDTIKHNYRTKTVGIATIGTPRISFSQRIDRWYTSLVTIPFHFDENES